MVALGAPGKSGLVLPGTGWIFRWISGPGPPLRGRRPSTAAAPLRRQTRWVACAQVSSPAADGAIDSMVETTSVVDARTGHRQAPAPGPGGAGHRGPGVTVGRSGHRTASGRTRRHDGQGRGARDAGNPDAGAPPRPAEGRVRRAADRDIGRRLPARASRGAELRACARAADRPAHRAGDPAPDLPQRGAAGRGRRHGSARGRRAVGRRRVHVVEPCDPDPRRAGHWLRVAPRRKRPGGPDQRHADLVSGQRLPRPGGSSRRLSGPARA